VVWFGDPSLIRPNLLGVAVEGYKVDSALARLVSQSLGLDVDAVKPVVRAIAFGFAREAAEAKAWRFFYHHAAGRVYYNDAVPCGIGVADIASRTAKTYLLDEEDCRDGLALVILEERLGCFADSISRRFGLDRAEVEARLRRLVEELKADPKSAFRAGFVRLAFFPPGSEEELEKMLYMYARDPDEVWREWRGQWFVEAWRELVKKEDGPLTPFEVFKAHLAGMDVVGSPPDGYKVYVSGRRVMVAGPGMWGWSVAWFKVGAGYWTVLGHLPGFMDALKKAWSVVGDLVVEDFKRGVGAGQLARGLEAAAASSFLADYGYTELVKAIYLMGRDGKSYARAVVGGRGGRVVVHVLRYPHEDMLEGAAFVVEHGGSRYLLDIISLARALRRFGTLALSPDMYREVAGWYDESKWESIKMETARRLEYVRQTAEFCCIPEDLVRWLEERTKAGEQERKREPVPAG